MMTRLLLWLHRVVTKALTDRGAFPSEPKRFSSPVEDIETADVAAMIPLDPDEPLDPRLTEILRAIPTLASDMHVPGVSKKAFAERPHEMPRTPNGERFVIWSRGKVDTITDHGRKAGLAWERVTKRAGIHQFWDTQHHRGQPRGLRDELVVSLESE